MPSSRVLLKLSGESLGSSGIEPAAVGQTCAALAEAAKGGQLAIVVGGGNLVRGEALAKQGGFAQAACDGIGMLGTVMNGLALQEGLRRLGVEARVMTPFPCGGQTELFNRLEAIRHLEQGRVVIFAGGTGNPFFTTDTCAALRGAEIEAGAVLKATKVDGIYDQDPKKFPDARRFDALSFDEAIARKLAVMDLAAFEICRAQRLPIVVFDMNAPGAIREAVAGRPRGTRVG